MTEDELRSFFAKQKVKATISHYLSVKRVIYYATIGEDHLPAILFIHGSTGSMTIYKDYFSDHELLKRFSIYAVDRPGYGLTIGRPEVSIQRQAQMLLPLAQSIHRVHQPLIIVADTYGAVIACRLTMEHQHVVQGLVLINPIVGPGSQKTNPLASFVSNTFLKNLVSKENLSSIEEKKFLAGDLKKMSTLWNKITVPVSCLIVKHSADANLTTGGISTLLSNCSNLDIHFLRARRSTVLSNCHNEILNKILQFYQML